ncbi:DUF4148 domain-containing protein [Paraburkholderia sp. DHOC27]|uniref:DUF4148 domain-containing protein n=1 Tax=Paraburkholderia sp. DHOC27 TaxID=2303330 RepID=UPI000E3DB971|nr:DUF4148 domain-containing protein [Paraburkholderia sp. DHOC27]RFU48510.1 DUF4148 domain-containing protein [Paraburkholderia sp. DHOC27]
MKVIQSLLVAAAVALPALSFAQSNQPLTRAEVRAQLVELEKAGYKPTADETHYPEDIQSAEARVGAQQGLANTSYGSASTGTFAAGSRIAYADVSGFGSLYSKH